MFKTLPSLCGLIIATSANSANLSVEITIPRLNVAEYHRPYVAIWVERPDNSVAANLAVWYADKLANNEGNKWLKDLRQWWRRSGRELDFPVDGLTSATRPPGKHTLIFDSKAPPLKQLSPGSYCLQVEAARESGGRELLSIPFEWPPKQSTHLTVQGKHELNTVSATLTP